MKWFKENWKVILIVLNIPVLVMVSIMFWFYTDAYLIWNPENFNNIMSPVAGIVAAILFFVAIYQTNSSIKIARSQNQKQNLEEDLKDIKEQFLKERDVVLNNVIHRSSTSDGLNRIHQVLKSLKNNEQLGQDAKAKVNNDRLYFEGRSYYDDLRYFNRLTAVVFTDMYGVLNYLKVITSSPMIRSDKRYFYNKVNRQLLGELITVFNFFKHHPTGIVYPELVFNGDDVAYKSIVDSELGEIFIKIIDVTNVTDSELQNL